MTDDLVEKVARAIDAIQSKECVNKTSFEICEVFARAALRVALEEAEKVVKARDMGDGTREDQEAHRCAAAIRALIPEKDNRD